METESSFMFELLVSWGPIILLIVIWVAFMKKAGVSKSRIYMDNTTDQLAIQVEEMKKINSNLENIYAVLKESGIQKNKNS